MCRPKWPRRGGRAQPRGGVLEGLEASRNSFTLFGTVVFTSLPGRFRRRCRLSCPEASRNSGSCIRNRLFYFVAVTILARLWAELGGSSTRFGRFMFSVIESAKLSPTLAPPGSEV